MSRLFVLRAIGSYETVSSSRMKQRINLKLLVKLRKTPTTRFKLFKEVYGEDVMSRTQVFESHKCFEKGREEVEDDPKTRRPFKIVRTDSLFRLSSSDIIHTINLRSLCTSCFSLVMFSSVLVVKGRLVLGSSSTFSRLFSKRLCNSKICVLDITSSP